MNSRPDSGKHTPSDEDYQILSEIFKLLNDPTRLRIFLALCHEEKCVMDLAGDLSISSPALSHHLRLLKDGGLIVSRRIGKEVFYTAADTEESRTLHHAIEQIMKVSCPQRQKTLCSHNGLAEHSLSEQEKTFLEIHDYLVSHLDQRITIEELSRRFLMNTTTLKNGFKAVYGTSIAAHIREHRLEAAAELLLRTDRSVHEIALSVGYSSQSKFSAAFFERFHTYPLDYRKSSRPEH